MLDLSKCVAISALPPRRHQSCSELSLIPVWRPFHDPRIQPHDLQIRADDTSRSSNYQLAPSVVGKDAIPRHAAPGCGGREGHGW